MPLGWNRKRRERERRQEGMGKIFNHIFFEYEKEEKRIKEKKTQERKVSFIQLQLRVSIELMLNQSEVNLLRSNQILRGFYSHNQMV